jgi:hypothetical protein
MKTWNVAHVESGAFCCLEMKCNLNDSWWNNHVSWQQTCIIMAKSSGFLAASCWSSVVQSTSRSLQRDFIDLIRLKFDFTLLNCTNQGVKHLNTFISPFKTPHKPPQNQLKPALKLTNSCATHYHLIQTILSCFQFETQHFQTN